MTGAVRRWPRPVTAKSAASERPPADEAMREGELAKITAFVPLTVTVGRYDEAGRAPQRSQPGPDSGVRGSPEW